MKKLCLSLLLLLGSSALCSAQKISLDKIDPPYWWIGMKNQSVELMLYGSDIAQSKVEVNYPGVTISRTDVPDNRGYLFVTLEISNQALPGTIEIVIKNAKGKIIQKHPYQLKSRQPDSALRESFSAADVIYLIMPDRFANGNPNNDTLPSCKEKANRSHWSGRHGGDLQGMIDKVPYIAQLGVTAVWSNPLWEDNRESFTYHHYAASDFYKIDPRFGDNQLYSQFVEECHKNNLKVLIDIVCNHCGSEHPWTNNPPYKDWFNLYQERTRSNFKLECWNDPYCSEADKKLMLEGWFDNIMPDLNMRNPKLLTYLAQMTIWWIESANLDGIRVDTYPYNDLHQMAAWNQLIRNEYPHLNIVGECWMHAPSDIATFQEGSKNLLGINTYLPSVMDFNFTDVLAEALNETDSWSGGVFKLYQHHAMDYVYPNVQNIMTFLDNHDLPRYIHQVNGDLRKYKMGLALILTTRGIPQITYGTEIALAGNSQMPPMDSGRADFPGGWSSDEQNAFTAQGRTEIQNDIFEYTKGLLQWRKNKQVLHSGKTKHFAPEGSVYAYVRYNDKEAVMVIVNNASAEDKTVDLKRFAECYQGAPSGIEFFSGQQVDLTGSLTLSPKSIQIIEYKY